jgi:O-antigen/teichoic acid export membrane protein
MVVILVAGLMMLTTIISPSFDDPFLAFAFVCFGVAFFFSTQYLDLLNAYGLVAVAARTNAVGSLLCLAFVLVAFLAGWRLWVVVACYALSFAVQASIAIILSTKASRALPTSSAPGSAGRLTRTGVSLVGMTIGEDLAYRADTVLLGALTSPADAGLYAVAITPASVLRIPSAALGQVAMYDRASGVSSGSAVIRRILWLEIVILIPIAACGWAVADWAIPFFFGAEFAGSVDPFRVLLIAELALAPFLVASRAIAGQGSAGAASVAGLVGAMALVTAAIVLIPPFGAVGAAWASVLAYSAMSSIAVVSLLHKRAGTSG